MFIVHVFSLTSDETLTFSLKRGFKIIQFCSLIHADTLTVNTVYLDLYVRMLPLFIYFSFECNFEFTVHSTI